MYAIRSQSSLLAGRLLSSCYLPTVLLLAIPSLLPAVTCSFAAS